MVKLDITSVWFLQANKKREKNIVEDAVKGLRLRTVKKTYAKQSSKGRNEKVADLGYSILNRSQRTGELCKFCTMK